MNYKLSIRFLLPKAQFANQSYEPQLQVNSSLLDEEGQSFIEFVLLLASILFVSLTFMKLVSGNIGPIWETFANIILDNPNLKLTL